MNWDDLRIFLALARAQRLSEAGRRLKVDHTTVARRISALEKQLSRTLFERRPTGYVLTQAGEELLHYAQRMEATAVSASSSLSRPNEDLSGSVRVAVPEGIGAYAVTEAAQQLTEQHPELRIELLTNALHYSLSKREADFAIVLSRPKRGRLKAQKISDVTLHLYATQNYLDDFGPIETLNDLKPLRRISYVKDQIPDKQLDYDGLFDMLGEAQLTATGVLVQSAAIVNGAGYGVMHDFIAQAHPNLVRLLPDKISIKRSLWGVVHENFADIERIHHVGQYIVAYVRQYLRKVEADLSAEIDA